MLPNCARTTLAILVNGQTCGIRPFIRVHAYSFVFNRVYRWTTTDDHLGKIERTVRPVRLLMCFSTHFPMTHFLSSLGRLHFPRKGGRKKASQSSSLPHLFLPPSPPIHP